MKIVTSILFAVLAIIFATGVAQPAVHADLDDGTSAIVLTAHETKICEAGDGCVVITNKQRQKDIEVVRALVQMVHTCREGKGV